MTSDPNWREVARGIPVWVGAWFQGTPAWNQGDYPNIVKHINDDGSVWDGDDLWERGDVFPDLANPDTRAAYDRRLALALGAPDTEWHGFSIVLVRDGPFAGSLSFTIDHARGRWVTTVTTGDADPIRCRALAWPASQRVAR